MEYKSMRKSFGAGLVKAAAIDDRITALVSDLTNSVGFGEFAEKFPERFVNVGIAEQNIVCVASGMAHIGKIPFVGAYAAFSPGRNWEQIRTTICINDVPVKVVGSHAGVNVGPDGETHQALEDIALMRVLPNMVVLAPGDAVEAEHCALVMAQDTRPNYVRLPRADTPIIFAESHKFEIGKVYNLRKGRDVVILTTGTMTAPALTAAEILADKKIDASVVHCPTIKPLDEKAIVSEIKKCRKVVTIEEHQIAGGFGSAITELLTNTRSNLISRYQVRPGILRIGIDDEYGQSGSPEELLEYYGLTPEQIAKKIRQFLR